MIEKAGAVPQCEGPECSPQSWGGVWWDWMAHVFEEDQAHVILRVGGVEEE